MRSAFGQMRSAFGQMRCASDQLVKRAAFDQMRNVWSNARTFGQMRAHLTKCATFDQMRCALARVINAEHRNSNLLPLTNCAAHLAIGANEARKPGDTQLRIRVNSTHGQLDTCVESCCL